MNDITEKTNPGGSLTLPNEIFDDDTDTVPISIFFFEQYGENKNNRIEVYSFEGIKGKNPVKLNCYDLDTGPYTYEIWKDIDTQNELKLEAGSFKIQDARAV